MLEVGKYCKNAFTSLKLNPLPTSIGLQSLFFSVREQEASLVPSQDKFH